MDESNAPGSIIPALCVYCFVKDKRSMECLTLSTMGFLLYPYFLLLYRGGDN